MSGAKKTAKKLKKSFVPRIKDALDPRAPVGSLQALGKDDSFANPLNVLEEGAEDLGTLFTPELPQQEEQPLIPIPDEAARETQLRRRRSKRSKTGRQSTILTEGLGG